MSEIIKNSSKLRRLSLALNETNLTDNGLVEISNSVKSLKFLERLWIDFENTPNVQNAEGHKTTFNLLKGDLDHLTSENTFIYG